MICRVFSREENSLNNLLAIENVNYLTLVFEQFLSFGFIDDTGVTSCCPGSGPEPGEYGAGR